MSIDCQAGLGNRVNSTMYQTFERVWVSFLNSNRFRRFAKQGVGSVVFRSPTYRRLHLAKNYLTSQYNCLRDPVAFEGVKTFCLFVGHNKSGTSLIGSLLDAHPNVILADEVHAVDYVSAGFRRDQLFHILVRGSRREFLKGRVTARRLTPYSYLVPGQWQGRYSTLRVIGDGASGSSTQRFAKEPDLLQRLRDVMGTVNVKFVQVIRNPYDPISVMMVRGKRTFENAIDHYFANCDALVELRKRLDSSNLFAVRYEGFVSQPELHLCQLCRYLGIEPDDDYVSACVSILHKAPDQSHQMVAWDSKWIGVVKERIAQFDFLQGYSFVR